MMRHRCVGGFGLIGRAGALAVLAASAHGADKFWANPITGNWITNANWSPTGFPNNGDTATINVVSASPYTVTLANGVTISAFTLNHPNATLQINPGAGLNMGTGPVNITAGTFSMGNAVFTGTGTLTLAPGATMALNGCTLPSGMTYSLNGAVRITNTVQGFSTGGITNNGTMTLTGAGPWLFTQRPLTNNGTITADGVGGGNATISAQLNNATTGTVSLLTNTSTFGSPQTNSGSFSLAAAKTLTIGSFATVNQNAGTMTINGAYTHQNGAFNMNGGALTIPAGGSFFKDGGAFNYNAGTITGEPLIRSGTLGFGAGATNAASFRVRGPSGAVGNIPSNVTLTVEATVAEPASTGRIGAFSNAGAIRLIGGTTNAATLYAQGGTLTNTGTITVQSPPAVAGDGGVVWLAFLFAEIYNINIVQAHPNQDSINIVIDAQNANHRNTGQIETGAPNTPGGEPSKITIKAGSNATFHQDGGTITNNGAFTVGDGCTFQYTGGTCTGNPITIDGGTLSIGPSAGAASFSMQGANNVISSSVIAANQSVSCRPDVASGEAGVCVVTESPTGSPLSVAGSLNLEPGPTLNTTMTAPNGIFVLPAGAATVRNSNGYGDAIINAPAPYTITISDNISITPGVLNILGTTSLNTDVQNHGVLRTSFTFADGRPSERGAADAPVGVTISRTYAQGSNAALSLLVGGPGAGQTDSLSIAGAASLGGTLSVAPGAGYTPAWGNVFTIMTFASRSGDFSTFTTTALSDPNLRWWREARATDYRVGVRHVADVNHDGRVDFLDLNNVLSYYGSPAPTGSPASIGDANGDGVVDFLDLNLVLSFYGLQAP